ncbi:MAG: hypothetical protein LBR06_09365 [Bacteroidales bacterium]|jgi:hypothetical protein|nr:hypothetical protein [Bacteroidales bacterium]
MVKSILLAMMICVAAGRVCSQERREINIPDIPGYRTLKCDFHTHTVFSDADVWPTTRIDEAWRDGLDVVAITDAIEYRPHARYIQADHNQAYEIARPLAEQLGVVLIHGAEMSRDVTGNVTALFLANANLLMRTSLLDACKEAQSQGALLFWNAGYGKERGAVMTGPEISRLVTSGLIKAAEVFGGNTFYPAALKWAGKNRLSVMAGSNAHPPLNPSTDDRRRPFTLVFATAKTPEAIKQAIVEGRTAACFNDTIVGDRFYLTAVFLNSIQLLEFGGPLENQAYRLLKIRNNSDIPFLLHKRQPSIGFENPDRIFLPPHRTVVIELQGTSNEIKSSARLIMFCEIANLITLNGSNLQINLEIPNRRY